MDFESPDEIERSYNKKTMPVGRKPEYHEPQPVRKVPKMEEVFVKEDTDINYDVDGSESDYGSEYEQPMQNTESSIDSVDTDSEYDDAEPGGFKRLESDPSKKRLVIKDGRIVKTDKSKLHGDLSPSKFKSSGGKTPSGKTIKKITTSKVSPTALQSYQFGLTSYENINISPPSPRGKESSFKVNGIKPIDVAAHLKLLGESLTIIGERLKEHEGQIAVSGSLSVLLDSLLCALGPLLCLTQQIPELKENCCSSDQLISTLDNVAFIMPGL